MAAEAAGLGRDPFELRSFVRARPQTSLEGAVEAADSVVGGIAKIICDPIGNMSPELLKVWSDQTDYVSSQIRGVHGKRSSKKCSDRTKQTSGLA
jgi:hypothetical protein